MNTFHRWAIALLITPIASVQAQGLMTRNEASLSRFAPLPVVGEGTSPKAGQSHWGLTLDLTNEFYVEVLADETAQLDGETLATTLRWRHGLSERWAVGIDLPLVDSGRGFLDRWIEDWHEWFGLPNAGREQFPQDQYRFALTQNGATVFERDRGTTDLGDVNLRGSYALNPQRRVHNCRCPPAAPPHSPAAPGVLPVGWKKTVASAAPGAGAASTALVPPFSNAEDRWPTCRRPTAPLPALASTGICGAA